MHLILKFFILRLLNVAFTGGEKVLELWNVGLDGMNFSFVF